MAIFEGSAVALVLPMHEDGSIDYDGFRRQVQRMLDGGVQALLVNGTTGETATIHIDDEFKLLDITLEMAAGTGVKVIAGAGSNDTATALKKAHYAKEKGADAILVVMIISCHLFVPEEKELFQYYQIFIHAKLNCWLN